MAAITNINNLADNSLVKVFNNLPIEDLLQLPSVCPRWIQLTSVSCSSKRSLFLYDHRCTYLLRYMYTMFGSTFDMFHMYPIECEQLTQDFAKEIIEHFPMVERLEVAIDLDVKLLPFLQTLLEGYAKKLTHLKLVTGFLKVRFHHTNEHLFFHNLATFLRTKCCLPQLRHLTLYNEGTGCTLPLPILLPFANMPLLEELNYGMPCDAYPIRHVLSQLELVPKLRQFATLFQYTDHESAQLYTQIDLLNNEIAGQTTHLTFFYTHYFMDVSSYFDSLTKKFINLHHLHISLRFERIAIDDLLKWLTRLRSLRHLQLSDMPLNYLTEKFADYAKEEATTTLPCLNSVTKLQFSYVNWERYNSWQNVVTWRQIFPLVSKVFPGLKQVLHSHIRYHDFATNKGIPRPASRQQETHLKLSAVEGSNASRFDSLQMTVMITASLLCLNTSAFFIPLPQLITLLGNTPNLQYLHIRAPRHYFRYFDSTQSSVSLRLNSLATLHLDHISSGDGDPYDIIPCRYFAQTASLWPNLSKLKLDGLLAKFNFFDLSTREVLWLRALPTAWPHLRKVFIMDKLENEPEQQQQGLIEVSSQRSKKPSHYQVRYLLKEGCLSAEEEPERQLTIIQRIFEAKPKDKM